MNKVFQRNYQNNSMFVPGNSVGIKEDKIIILNNIIQQPETAKENLDQNSPQTTSQVIIDLEAPKTDTQTNSVMTDIEDIPKQLALAKPKKKMFGK